MSVVLRRIFRDSHQQLAEIPTLEKALKSTNRLVDPIYNVLPVTNLAVIQPSSHIFAKCRLPVRVIKNDEPLHLQALGQYGAGKSRQ